VIKQLLLVAILIGLYPLPSYALPTQTFDDKSKCFIAGSMYVCANNLKEGVYTVAVLAPEKSPYPASMLVTCNGKPEADAFGTMPPVMPSDFLEQFCAYVEGMPFVPDTEQYI
jgi:hypothetical protein